MNEMEDDEIRPEQIYRPNDIVWVKISSMWWPAEVCDKEKLDPDLTDGLKKPPLAVVKFLQEDVYEFIRDFDLINHYHCKKKTEFLKLGFEKYLKHKNEAKVALFPLSVQEAERRTGGDPEIIHDPEFGLESADGSKNKTIDKRRLSLVSNATNRSRPEGEVSVQQPSAPVKRAPTWDPYPKINRRAPPADDSSRPPVVVRQCSKCSYQSTDLGIIMWHHKQDQHRYAHTGRWHSGNPKKKEVVKRKKDDTLKPSKLKKKKQLAAPVGESTPAKKVKKEAPAALEISHVAEEVRKEWDDCEEEDGSVAGEDLDLSIIATDTQPLPVTGDPMPTAGIQADGKDETSKATEPATNKSSCFDFDEEEPSEPTLQSLKVGKKLPPVITPDESKPTKESVADSGTDDLEPVPPENQSTLKAEIVETKKYRTRSGDGAEMSAHAEIKGADPAKGTKDVAKRRSLRYRGEFGISNGEVDTRAKGEAIPDRRKVFAGKPVGDGTISKPIESSGRSSNSEVSLKMNELLEGSKLMTSNDVEVSQEENRKDQTELISVPISESSTNGNIANVEDIVPRGTPLSDKKSKKKKSKAPNDPEPVKGETKGSVSSRLIRREHKKEKRGSNAANGSEPKRWKKDVTERPESAGGNSEKLAKPETIASVTITGEKKEMLQKLEPVCCKSSPRSTHLGSTQSQEGTLSLAELKEKMDTPAEATLGSNQTACSNEDPKVNRLALQKVDSSIVPFQESSGAKSDHRRLSRLSIAASVPDKEPLDRGAEKKSLEGAVNDLDLNESALEKEAPEPEKNAKSDLTETTTDSPQLAKEASKVEVEVPSKVAIDLPPGVSQQPTRKSKRRCLSSQIADQSVTNEVAPPKETPEIDPVTSDVDPGQEVQSEASVIAARSKNDVSQTDNNVSKPGESRRSLRKPVAKSTAKNLQKPAEVLNISSAEKGDGQVTVNAEHKLRLPNEKCAASKNDSRRSKAKSSTGSEKAKRFVEVETSTLEAKNWKPSPNLSVRKSEEQYPDPGELKQSCAGPVTCSKTLRGEEASKRSTRTRRGSQDTKPVSKEVLGHGDQTASLNERSSKAKKSSQSEQLAEEEELSDSKSEARPRKADSGTLPSDKLTAMPDFDVARPSPPPRIELLVASTIHKTNTEVIPSNESAELPASSTSKGERSSKSSKSPQKPEIFIGSEAKPQRGKSDDTKTPDASIVLLSPKTELPPATLDGSTPKKEKSSKSRNSPQKEDVAMERGQPLSVSSEVKTRRGRSNDTKMPAKSHTKDPSQSSAPQVDASISFLSPKAELKIMPITVPPDTLPNGAADVKVLSSQYVGNCQPSQYGFVDDILNMDLDISNMPVVFGDDGNDLIFSDTVVEECIEDSPIEEISEPEETKAPEPSSASASTSSSTTYKVPPNPWTGKLVIKEVDEPIEMVSRKLTCIEFDVYPVGHPDFEYYMSLPAISPYPAGKSQKSETPSVSAETVQKTSKNSVEETPKENFLLQTSKVNPQQQTPKVNLQQQTPKVNSVTVQQPCQVVTPSHKTASPAKQPINKAHLTGTSTNKLTARPQLVPITNPNVRMTMNPRVVEMGAVAKQPKYRIQVSKSGKFIFPAPTTKPEVSGDMPALIARKSVPSTPTITRVRSPSPARLGPSTASKEAMQEQPVQTVQLVPITSPNVRMTMNPRVIEMGAIAKQPKYKIQVSKSGKFIFPAPTTKPEVSGNKPALIARKSVPSTPTITRVRSPSPARLDPSTASKAAIQEQPVQTVQLVPITSPNVKMTMNPRVVEMGAIAKQPKYKIQVSKSGKFIFPAPTTKPEVSGNKPALIARKSVPSTPTITRVRSPSPARLGPSTASKVAIQIPPSGTSREGHILSTEKRISFSSRESMVIKGGHKVTELPVQTVQLVPNNQIKITGATSSGMSILIDKKASPMVTPGSDILAQALLDTNLEPSDTMPTADIFFSSSQQVQQVIYTPRTLPTYTVIAEPSSTVSNSSESVNR